MKLSIDAKYKDSIDVVDFEDKKGGRAHNPDLELGMVKLESDNIDLTYFITWLNAYYSYHHYNNYYFLDGSLPGMNTENKDEITKITIDIEGEKNEFFVNSLGFLTKKTTHTPTPDSLV